MRGKTILGESRVVPSVNCPSCGKELDAATCFGDDLSPSPGDITICAGCGHLMAFATDLKLRDLTDEEIWQVAGDKRMLLVQAALAATFPRKK